MKRYIDADKLKERFVVSGLFDSGELVVILQIIEEEPIHKAPAHHGGLIGRNRVLYELCESNMPKIYRDFCRRVLTDEELTPTIIKSEE